MKEPGAGSIIVDKSGGVWIRVRPDEQGHGMWLDLGLAEDLGDLYTWEVLEPTLAQYQKSVLKVRV